ncbi:MAG: cation-translocating P-type ATPase [Candidatus Bathyarchaeia archaeon]
MTAENLSFRGLTENDVAQRRVRDGYNELPSAKRRSVLRIALDVAQEPMFLLLIACGTLYLILGDLEEALMLLGFVFVVMGITLYQERRTERALEALRDLSSPRALVIRGDEQKRIPARELVSDDIVLLSEGDRVPADAIVLNSTNLTVDESLLTGESVPVRKSAWDGKEKTGRLGGDDLPFVYSGTLVVKGQGITRVTATGLRTEVGKIGKALQTLEPEETSLQRQTKRIVRYFALVGLILCVTVVVVFGLRRGDWLSGLLAGITLAMATLPEEFPVVLTIFLALGAWRISHRHVLTRRMPAVETLGAATVLCVDKTGTLTLNRMQVSELAVGNEIYRVDDEPTSLPERFHELVEFSILASPPDPFDPMEKAMKELGRFSLSGTEHIHQDWELMREYPLSAKMLAMLRVWRSQSHDDYVIAGKGAPEAIADLCHFDKKQLEIMNAQIEAMADHGLRVIGVARGQLTSPELPTAQHDFEFQFLGLLGLSDPVRPEVPNAIQECYGAGIRVIMITGDYPGTAKSIAQQIGLRSSDQIMTGPQLDQMDDDTLRERIKNVNVFARVVPEQKLRIVDALKEDDEVVAMTGDGVNDAPALKSANIGVAMGGRGTDVARESAALVLLDDNFASIVQAVRMGRRIFDNLRKAMSFIVSVHIPIAGMSLIPVLLNWPLILFPVHVVFLELIIDPACSVVFEAQPEETNVMRRPPRRLNDPLFGRTMVLRSFFQGLSVLAIVFVVFVAVMTISQNESEARAASFATLVIANLGLISSNRDWTRSFFKTVRTRNMALWWVSGGTALFLLLALTIPSLQSLFRFAPLHATDLILGLVAGALSILISECLKTRLSRELLGNGPSL